MPTLFNKALQLITGDPASQILAMPKKRSLKKYTERELINMESKIGSQLFGPIPHGHRREFFCLDDKTWIWHEEWKDEKGAIQEMTTRYELQEKGVLKVQPGPRYTYLEGQELKNLVMAIRIYYEKTMREVYRRDPATGKKLA